MGGRAIGRSAEIDSGQRKANVIKDKFYPIGDKNKIVKSHYVDNRIVFSQGRDCYIYNFDADNIIHSKYYSDISHCFETDISHLRRKTTCISIIVMTMSESLKDKGTH